MFQFQREENHSDHHRRNNAWIVSLVGQHRDRLGIEPNWIIRVHLLCAKETVEEDTLPNGYVEWMPDTYEATLGICCDLPYGLLRWETIHELMELSLYRTGTVCDHCFHAVREYGSVDMADLFMSQYRLARNQEIETLVERYLGESRPVIENTLAVPCPSRSRRIRQKPALLLPPWADSALQGA